MADKNGSARNGAAGAGTTQDISCPSIAPLGVSSPSILLVFFYGFGIDVFSLRLHPEKLKMYISD